MSENLTMDKQTQELLDFGKIRDELAAYTVSPEGKKLILEQDFLFEAEALKDFLDRVGEFKMLLEASEGLPPLDFAPIDFLPAIEKEGTVAEGTEAAALGRYIRASLFLKKYLGKKPENHPHYTALFGFRRLSNI